MDEENKKFVVNIYGSEYVIKANLDEDFMNRLAEYVDQKMREIAGQTNIASTQRLAVLTALYIAGEYFAVKEQAPESIDYSEINKRLQELIKKIDLELKI